VGHEHFASAGALFIGAGMGNMPGVTQIIADLAS